MGFAEFFDFRVQHALPLDTLAILVLAQIIIVAQLHLPFKFFKKIIKI